MRLAQAEAEQQQAQEQLGDAGRRLEVGGVT